MMMGMGRGGPPPPPPTFHGDRDGGFGRGHIPSYRDGPQGGPPSQFRDGPQGAPPLQFRDGPFGRGGSGGGGGYGPPRGDVPPPRGGPRDWERGPPLPPRGGSGYGGGRFGDGGFNDRKRGRSRSPERRDNNSNNSIRRRY